MVSPKKRVAIIGSGVAGLTAAFYLSRQHHVDVFEKSSTLGGHTATVSVSNRYRSTPLCIDTGFIVFNEKNYPQFVKLLNELGIDYCNSDMSFSFTNESNKICWGSDFPGGVFAKPYAWMDPSHYLFLWGIRQFNQACLTHKNMSEHETLASFLNRHRISDTVITNYVVPMTTAIWSVSAENALKFPMTSFVRFWKNHDLLRIGGGLQWKTIPGGAKRYVDAIHTAISGSVFLNANVQTVGREGHVVWVKDPQFRDQKYDAVVLATHADQALNLLENPLPLEKKLLSKWQYSTNKVILHTDATLMPPIKSAWCSWNVHSCPGNNEVSLTYWMNRLQPLPTSQNYFVSLNPAKSIPHSDVVMQSDVTHPIMTAEAMDTQLRLSELNRESALFFCGSYFGYGFHEDAVASAKQAVEAVENYFES